MSQPGQHEHVGRDGVTHPGKPKIEVMESGKTSPWNTLGCPPETQRWIWVVVMSWSSPDHGHVVIISLSQASHGCVVVISCHNDPIVISLSLSCHAHFMVMVISRSFQLQTWSENSTPDLGVGDLSLHSHFLSQGHGSLPAPQDSWGPLSQDEETCPQLLWHQERLQQLGLHKQPNLTGVHGLGSHQHCSRGRDGICMETCWHRSQAATAASVPNPYGDPMS